MLRLNGLVPYTCSRCRGVTYERGGLVAVTCQRCGVIDLGTELARDRWRTVAEVRLADRPARAHCPSHPAPSTRRLWGFAAACAVGAAAALWRVLR